MAQPKIAVLGLGKMGAAAVRRLVALNYEVAVWNRTEAKGQALAAESALVSVKSSAREALHGPTVFALARGNGGALC